MPIYEFECSRCGSRFEELVANSGAVTCPQCGSPQLSRLLSPVAPPGRQPRGAKVRDSESRRREREAQRRERLTRDRARRASS